MILNSLCYQEKPLLILPKSPERWLIHNVILRAIWDLAPKKNRCRVEGSETRQKIVREAKKWLFGKSDPTEPFTFAWCAQHVSDLPEAFMKMVQDRALAEMALTKASFHVRFRQ